MNIIYDLFGVDIPLPIQTFGFWVAMAFLAAAFIISTELKRKESEGLLSSFTVIKTIGENIKTRDIISSLIVGFLLGFKGFESVLYYSELVANPQEFMLSGRGNFFGGIFSCVLEYLDFVGML